MYTQTPGGSRSGFVCGNVVVCHIHRRFAFWGCVVLGVGLWFRYSIQPKLGKNLHASCLRNCLGFCGLGTALQPKLGKKLNASCLRNCCGYCCCWSRAGMTIMVLLCLWWCYHVGNGAVVCLVFVLNIIVCCVVLVLRCSVQFWCNEVTSIKE